MKEGATLMMGIETLLPTTVLREQEEEVTPLLLYYYEDDGDYCDHNR